MRGNVVIVRFPHPTGLRGKRRPAVVLQSDTYAGQVRTVVVADVTKNLSMAADPACLFIDVSTPEGQATGLVRNSVVSGLILSTVYADSIGPRIGALSPAMMQRLNDCLRAALHIT
jgi:mRNA interferase MazF